MTAQSNREAALAIVHRIALYNRPNREAALVTIHRVALRNHLTTATAESLTAGQISATLASLAGASGYHQGGIAAYNLTAKVNLLGVNQAQAEQCNGVSKAVTLQMAYGAREAFAADCVIAVTGYTETGLTGGVVEPCAYYAILIGEDIFTGFILLNLLGREKAREVVVTRTLWLMAELMEAVYARD